MFGVRDLRCPRCNRCNISVQMIEGGSRTKKTGVGLGGNVYNAVRGVANVSTLGIAGIIMPKATGKEKTKNKLVKTAICQDCGHSWEIR